MFKNTKKVLALVLAVAVVAMSMFSGFVVSAADVTYTTAHGIVDLLEFGDYLTEAGSTSKYYDSVLADNGETGADWANAIIIDSAEELVYLCKASGVDTEGKYYKVADGIAGFNLASSNLDVNGTFASPSKAEGKTNFDVVKGNGKNHSGGGGEQGFRGYFDGNGATVYGAWTNHEQVSPYAGLFSATVGTVTIKNIHVKMAHFTATTAVGGIVGFHSSTDMATLTIENCSVTDSYFEVNASGWNKGVGAILGCGNSAPAKREANDDVDYNGDGDKVDTIYINDPYIIKNCYVNLDADNFVTVGGFAPGTVEGQQVCRGGVIGVSGSNAAMVQDCVVIGITPYATSISSNNNAVQHSGLESHFANVYTTADVAVADVAIGGTVGLRQFTGKVFPTADANLKGAAAANLNLDWSVWMLDDEGYPELANAHKNATLVDNEDGTHAATCACGFGGAAATHTFVDGTCDCGAELNCATRKTIYWDGTVASGIATGTGAKDDPFVIKTANELAWLIQQKADVTTDKYYEIDSAIGAIVLQPEAYGEAIKNLGSAAAVKAYFEANAGSMKTWPFVGWEGSCFAGEFEGNGVKIYGIYQVSTNNAGLFSTVDGGAAFHNLAVMNSYLTSTAGNYQVGGIFAVTSSGSYGAMRTGAVWLDSCIVANNYMNNASDSHDRSGVLYGASSDMVYIDNCLTYGNDATYVGKQMPFGGNAFNSASIHSNPATPDGLELVAEENEQALVRNMIRNTIFFDTIPFDNAQTIGSRFNDPNCYVNVLTNLALEDYTFAGADGPVVFPATEEQIKVVADLADVELGDAFIKTAGMPELRSFHDAVFTGGTSVGLEGHAGACSCGLPSSNVEPHSFVCDVEEPEWDSYYCEGCGYVCEHVDVEEGMVEYEGDCVTGSGYTFDCSICSYHEEEFDDATGHSFVNHEEQIGPDCQTPGTIAYKECLVCEKNYATDAADLEPFENALTDITGQVAPCAPVTDAETGEVVYTFDDENHWANCATCGEMMHIGVHTSEAGAQANGITGHAIECDVCDYASESAPHNFDAGVCVDCGYECEHEYDGVCDAECNYCYNYREAEEHTYDNACDVTCNVCGDERFFWGHNYDDDSDAVCNDCGAVRAVIAVIEVDVTGAYTIVPNDGYAAEFSAADIIVTDKNGAAVKYNDKVGGFPLVKGETYVVEFTEAAAENVVGEIEWAVEKIEGTIFADVPAGEWYNDAVTYSVGAGIITGYGGTNNFGAADKISRHDFVVILARFAGVDLSAYDDAEIPFKDVADNQYYTNAILWAAESGITSGYTSGVNAGKFGVGDEVTREQLVTFLYRYASNINGSAPKVSDDAAEKAATYPDFEAVGSYAKEPVIWALDKGVISGQGGTHIAPGGNALRAEVAKIFYNVYLNDTFVPTTSANTDVFAPVETETEYVINFVRNSDSVYDDAYVYTWTPEFDGVLTLTSLGDDEWVRLENSENSFEGVELMPYDTVTFNAKAGTTYIINVMTWSEDSGLAVFTATYTEGVALEGAGTEMEPYVVTDLELLPAVGVGETVYFVVAVPSVTSAYKLTIMGSRMATYDVNVNMGQYTGTAMGGSVMFENVTPGRRGTIMFAITNTGLMPLEAMYTLEEVALPSVGTENDPDTLVLDAITTAVVSGPYYYSFTADAAGTLSIEMKDNLCASGWVCSISGGAAEAAYQESVDDAHVNPVTYAVEAGETVTVWVATSEYAAGEVYFTATFA